MKSLLTFFIFICLYLPGGRKSDYASSHLLTCYHSSGIQPVNIKAVERTGEGERILLMNHPDTPGENELPVFAEDDEDDNTRKCKSPVESFSAFLDTAITSPSSGDLTGLLPIRRYTSSIGSCIYIEQRVLRI